MTHVRLILAAALLLASAAVVAAAEPSRKQLGTSFPASFPVIIDASLGTPVIGFGSDEGPVAHVPVIFLHGNNDTPFPTACNPFGHIHDFAQFFLDRGYRPSELWGLGYEGDLCDLLSDPTLRSGPAHTATANVADLRAFVAAVLDFTGARQVDIVAHSLGVAVAREWMRQDAAFSLVRRLVAVDGPNHGIIDCSPSPLNFFQLAVFGGFTPDSAVCVEFGAADTPFLLTLNGVGETPGPTEYLVIRNVAAPGSGDFVYISAQDGVFPPVPAIDRNGNPHDFSQSALLKGAASLDLIDQGQFDPILQTAHLGILNSPSTWRAAWQFLRPRGTGK